MISRALVSRRRKSASALVLGLFACALVFALGAASAMAAEGEGCSKESVRKESNVNPATGKAYSVGLPECRAYEVVSPHYKQEHDAGGVTGVGLPVAPDGNTMQFGSEGDFAGAQNYRVNLFPENVYLSERGSTGWVTTSAFAPRSVLDVPSFAGLFGVDFSLDMKSVEVSCGSNPAGNHGEERGQTFQCARRTQEPDGSWGAWAETPPHTTLNGAPVEGTQGYLGGSADLSRVFYQPENALLPADTRGLASGGGDGIYEDEFVGLGAGGTSDQLRLVNVNNKGEELNFVPSLGASPEGAFIGNNRQNPKVEGSSYQAISESGNTVFFEASPTTGPRANLKTLYARVNHEKTVTISGAEEGEAEVGEPLPGQFEGASADGSKVFFTTDQALLPADKDTTMDLYEYEFQPGGKHSLTLISEGSTNSDIVDPHTAGVGAEVEGVLRNSADGSHIYFVALGALTSESETNKEGEFAKGGPGNENLYGYDTVTKQLKFVATLGDGSGRDQRLWGEEGKAEPNLLNSFDEGSREVQVTPDGKYVVFASERKLAGDPNAEGPKSVYRYDFEDEELTWVSHPAEAGLGGEKMDATIGQQDDGKAGADAAINDTNRAISNDGEFIVFATSEKLQGDDQNGTSDAYLWHHPNVSLISDGQGPRGHGVAREATMSASGSDIFFTSNAQLVGQDTDNLADIYDARINGGFKAPEPPEECTGEPCQLPHPGPTSFGPTTSSQVAAGGNLGPSSGGVLSAVVEKPKTLTKKQKLAKALKVCKSKPKKKRASCEKQARKKYGPKAKAKKAKAKKSQKGGK